MSHVRIAITGASASDGTVHLDGQDVSRFTQGFTLAARVGEATQLKLNIAAREAAEFDGEAAVSVDPEFAKMLVGLGWTPPEATHCDRG